MADTFQGLYKRPLSSIAFQGQSIRLHPRALPEALSRLSAEFPTEYMICEPTCDLSVSVSVLYRSHLAGGHQCLIIIYHDIMMGLSSKSIVRNLKPGDHTRCLHLHPFTSAGQCKDGPGVLVNNNDRNSGVWLVSVLLSIYGWLWTCARADGMQHDGLLRSVVREMGWNKKNKSEDAIGVGKASL